MWRISSSLALMVLFLTGCATLLTRQSDYIRMDQQAALKGFKKIYISAPPFTLTAYQRITAKSDVMVVYIEGDGLAWVSRAEPSLDPTPKHPIAFQLACADPSPNVIYLARPGQFEEGGTPSVEQAYWTEKRFSPQVIQSTREALDALKNSLGVTKISLVGYSGGAAVAVLVAARRNDVIALRTVAGNLDPALFATLHHVSPLTGSLDPLAVASSVRAIAQLHFVGGRDGIVPQVIARSFLEREGYLSGERLVVLQGVHHAEGWVERWHELLKMPLINSVE